MKIEKYIEQAENFRNKGFFKKSIKLWHKIYKKCIQKNNPMLTIDSLIALGDLSRIIGKFNKSIDYYKEALELSEILEYNTYIADSISGLALSYKGIGKWKESLKFIKKARRIYERNIDKKGIAFTLWAEGAIWRFGGRIKKSLDSYEKALQIFKKLKDISALGYTYCGLGGSSRIKGNFSESLKFYRKANEIFKKTEDKFGTAYSYCGIGNAFRMMNNLKEAEKNFNKALSIYKKIGDIVSSSYTLWSLALTKLISEYKSKKQNKNYQEAFKFVLLAEKNFKKCNDPRGLIYCKIIKAMIHYLKYNRIIGKKILIEAINSAKNYDFILEEKYAQGILNDKYTVPYNIP